MQRLIWICLAGALGTGARHLVQTWAAQTLGLTFPWGTLIVNLAGSFAICAIMQVGLTTDLLSPDLRIVITAGFLGGLTTYSAFNYETVRLVQQGMWRTATLNVVVTLVGCGLAGVLGLALGRTIVQH
jgi:CrcB protein